VVVTDAQKQVIKTGTATRDEKNKAQLTVPLEQTLAPGTYQVDWHVVSVDGHKTKGSYHFSVK
jgi:methionine-rich copper-binding protein CopC